MTCKHENADHLMPGECFVRNGFASYVLVEQFRCLDCHAYLSLGDSDEHASVAVEMEIRAAEIAADLDEADRLCDWTMSNDAFIGLTAFEERRGWSIAESNMQHHSNAWLAGYLARCIATHEDERPMTLDEVKSALVEGGKERAAAERYRRVRR